MSKSQKLTRQILNINRPIDPSSQAQVAFNFPWNSPKTPVQQTLKELKNTEAIAMDSAIIQHFHREALQHEDKAGHSPATGYSVMIQEHTILQNIPDDAPDANIINTLESIAVRCEEWKRAESIDTFRQVACEQIPSTITKMKVLQENVKDQKNITPSPKQPKG